MKSKTFHSKVSKLGKGLYGGLTLVFAGSSILTFLRGGEVWVSLILLLLASVFVGILYATYRIRYELADQELRAHWIWGSEKIEYDEINDFHAYKLPLTALRRFGVSMLGGRYSHGETGKFYAIFGSRDGIIIEADSSSVYGGKLFISPKNPERFIEELENKSE